MAMYKISLQIEGNLKIVQYQLEIKNNTKEMITNHKGTMIAEDANNEPIYAKLFKMHKP